jgi:hypothetical protein
LSGTAPKSKSLLVLFFRKEQNFLEHFPTSSNRISRPENALPLCFGEHFNPTGDPMWSDNALPLRFGEHFNPTGDPMWSDNALELTGLEQA